MMKKILIVQLILVITTFSVGFKKIDPIVVETILTNEAAQFPGGNAKMQAWIKENLRSPKENFRPGIVRMEFTVKKSGK